MFLQGWDQCSSILAKLVHSSPPSLGHQSPRAGAWGWGGEALMSAVPRAYLAGSGFFFFFFHFF